MIYTLTLNPAIDYVVTMDQLEEGAVNRTNSEQFYAGGKGINVSQILNQHQIENIALGFVSGFTGNFIENSLHEKGIKTDFIQLPEGYTRINLKAKTLTQETEINGLGHTVTQPFIDQFNQKINALVDGDVLVLAGSLAKGLPDDFYEQVMKKLQDKLVKIVVDSTKNTLLMTLKYRPFLIKPNHHEIAEMFEVNINTTEELLTYGNKLKDMGARNVLISMGKDGAILIAEDGHIYQSNVPKGVVKNSVGAGDSMVAGFVAGYLKTNSYSDALRLGAASGSATAFSSDVAKADDIQKLVKEIKVQLYNTSEELT